MRWGVDDKWRRKFAWRPVKLMNGRRVWLEWVEVARFVGNPEVPFLADFNVRPFSSSFVARIPFND